MNTGEGFGVAAFAAGLAAFVVAVVLAVTHTLDDVIVWALGDELVATLQTGLVTAGGAAALVVLVAKTGVGGGRATSGRMTSGHGHARVVRRGRRVEVHTAPHHARSVARRRRIAADHEAGHAAAGRARGWKVEGMEVRDDGSGVTRFRTPRRYDPRDDIAISLAGGMAARTWSGCASDLAYANAARDRLPKDKRDAGWREGERRARSALFWRAGERQRDARTLQERSVA